MTIDKWRKYAREIISGIGQNDPLRASQLSTRVLHFSGRQEEILELTQAGIEVPRIVRPGLLGGMMEEAAPLILSLVKIVVKVALQGNKNDMQTIINGKGFVKATIAMPDGRIIEGQHKGERTLSNGTRMGTLRPKKYTALCTGQGEFHSTVLTYRGNFYNDRFHDLEGNAVCCFANNQRYTGCFQNGVRRGHGKLEIYDSTLGMFYTYFEGDWFDDKPYTGKCFDSENNEVGHFERGTYSQKFKASPTASTTARTATTSVASTTQKPAMPTSSVTAAVPVKVIDPDVPPETACPIIAEVLCNPKRSLSLDESIEILTICIAYGAIRADEMKGKKGVVVIGNTGAGKSTFVNSETGRTMVLKQPNELGITGMKPLVVVQPPEDGGAYKEMMRIGHTKQSQTFMPQIGSTPSGDVTFCDCPGFLDNRGAAINIANAVNIRAAISRADGVSVVILINYHSLLADRGRGLSDMLQICASLFGHIDHLIKHKDSVMLGITQVPLDANFENIKAWLVDGTPDVMQTLVERLFIYDPLDREIKGSISKEECLARVADLPPIANPGAIFRTVLTDSDEQELLKISEKMGEAIDRSLKDGDFSKAAEHLRHLENLSVIDHISIERLINKNRLVIERYLQSLVTDFKGHCNFEDFAKAEGVLSNLQIVCTHFKGFTIKLEELKAYQEKAKEKQRVRVAKERESAQRLEKAQGNIEELLKLLDQQKAEMRTRLSEQNEKFDVMQRQMREEIATTKRDSEAMQHVLRQEMEVQLAKKQQAFEMASSQDQKEQLAKISREKDALAAEYRRKLQLAEQEASRRLELEESRQSSQQQEIVKQRRELEQQLRELERQKTLKSAELREIERAKEERRQAEILAQQQALAAQRAAASAAAASSVSVATSQLPSIAFGAATSQLPSIAFGAAEWAKYFGDVGVEPALPSNIETILNSACPYFRGKKVRDTHILVLVPNTVGGKPLTLGLLGELMKSPKQGYASCYGNCDDDMQRVQFRTSSKWVLLLNEVIPTCKHQSVRKMVKHVQPGYVVPSMLQMATGIFTNYVRTKEKLFVCKYAFCRETSTKWRGMVGMFNAKGLHVMGGDQKGCNNFGLGVVREL